MSEPARMPASLPFPWFLRGTWTGDHLAALYRICEVADRQTARWRAVSGLGCPAGCGNCCRRHEPTVLPLEAMAVAAWIRVHRPASIPVLVEPRSAPRGQCPFYDHDNPLHCTVYPARPLLCRLFAFSSTRAKDATSVFRLCRDMPGPTPRISTEVELRNRYGEAPPVAQDTAVRLAALADGRPDLLGRLATDAWRKLEHLESLARTSAPGVAGSPQESYDGRGEGR